jgi:L-serine dehydratase
MTISAFDLFKVGIGPSSSHTVGPMRAACAFALRLQEEGLLARVARVRCELFGSLGATGHGHGSVKAVVLGLEGERPELVDPTTAGPRLESVRHEGKLLLAGEHPIAFSVDDDVVLHRRKRLDFHTTG